MYANQYILPSETFYIHVKQILTGGEAFILTMTSCIINLSFTGLDKAKCH